MKAMLIALLAGCPDVEGKDTAPLTTDDTSTTTTPTGTAGAPDCREEYDEAALITVESVAKQVYAIDPTDVGLTSLAPLDPSIDPATTVARTRTAYPEYAVLAEVEAGLVLTGTEVKSLRQGQMTLGDAYARFAHGELYLVNAHIPEYKMGGYVNHEPTRPRKLLLHKRELDKISKRIEERGLTVIPLAVYFKRGYAKVRLGVARGKKTHDKREAIARRDAARAIQRSGRGE
jgi:SsrA-binding protein